MCFIREYDSLLMPMNYKKTQIKKYNKQKIFTHTFLNIDESRNLTILK
jgi:hypothetical protein